MKIDGECPPGPAPVGTGSETNKGNGPSLPAPRRPDQYLRLVNGEDAEAYDRHLIADLLCKIESDDVHFRGYFQAIVDQIELLGLREQRDGFCLNLIDHLWIDARAEARATIYPYTFHPGGGLGREEDRKGVRSAWKKSRFVMALFT